MNARERETKEEVLLRWVKEGIIDPNCAGCKIYYESDKHPYNIMNPRHVASKNCESGKRAHCTCDVCF